MAAIIGSSNIEVAKTGTAVSIPTDNKGRLMFYLDCICNVLNLENNAPSLSVLRDYRNCHQLSESQLDDLLILCVLISPDELLNKCIFHDDQLCGDYQNEFYDIASVQNRLLITSNILVGGQTKKVKKIMTFKMVFLESNYYTPIRFYADRLQRIARGEAPPPPQPPQQNITYMITYTNPPVPQRSNDGCCTIL